jgi:hypothetical protein
MFPCTTRLGDTAGEGKLQALGKSAPASQRVRKGTTNKAEQYKVSGEDSEQRTSLRWTFGGLS